MGHYRKKKPSKPVNETKIKSKTDTDLLYYIQVIKKRIYTIWNIPANIKNLNELPVVKVKIKLLKSGQVAGIQFVTSSFNDTFDRSIKNAINNASPYPSFPSGLKEDYLEIIINFDAKR